MRARNLRGRRGGPIKRRITNPVIFPKFLSLKTVRPDGGLAVLHVPATTTCCHRGNRVRRRCSCAATDDSIETDSNGLDLFPAAQTSSIRTSWHVLMRWSKFRTKSAFSKGDVLQRVKKVVVFGGGSFATAMGTALARQKGDLDVVLLLRDRKGCDQINSQHQNLKYLPGTVLPNNLRATTDAKEAICGVQYAIHAVPVQATRQFLAAVKDLLAEDAPIICVSKGIERESASLLSDVIPEALGRRHPCVFLSGPSFAKEVIEGKLTCVVAASKDRRMSRKVQALFAQGNMRISLSSDVQGVEICGALKNVLAIAAGIVEGKGLGSNALAAVISQGCAEIRWLALAMNGRPETVAGLSGFADIMLTCYGALSRNRQVGIRLGRGEPIQDILASSTQVAEGVATAGSVVSLARRFHVSLPVLTAVASVLANDCTIEEAVQAVIDLPMLEER